MHVCACVAKAVFAYERNICLDAQRAWEIPLIVCKIKKKNEASLFVDMNIMALKVASVSAAITLKEVTYP